MAWGYHFSLDCNGCDLDAMKDYDTVYNFAKELVERIDMKAYGEPQIVHFGEGDKEGFTLVQLIETSNITAHFANESANIYLDVFSCKEYDMNDVADVVMKYFKPNLFHQRFFERD